MNFTLSLLLTLSQSLSLPFVVSFRSSTCCHHLKRWQFQRCTINDCLPSRVPQTKRRIIIAVEDHLHILLSTRQWTFGGCLSNNWKPLQFRNCRPLSVSSITFSSHCQQPESLATVFNPLQLPCFCCVSAHWLLCLSRCLSATINVSGSLLSPVKKHTHIFVLRLLFHLFLAGEGGGGWCLFLLFYIKIFVNGFWLLFLYLSFDWENCQNPVKNRVSLFLRLSVCEWIQLFVFFSLFVI